MSEMMPFAIMLGNGIGQLAVIAILFGTLQRRNTRPLTKAALAALLFALCGLLTMAQPARFDNGVVVDLRGVIVGLAGAFAGWPAALAAAIATAIYRVHLGGIYVAGCASIALAAAIGLLWRWRVRDLRVTRARYLTELGILIALHPLPLAFVPAVWNAETLVPTLTTLLAASLAGALAFGKLLERELTLIAHERHLTREALHDPLTNLLNRRGFEAAFLEARGLDHDAPLALLLIDIDHFKGINDRHGHEAGDTVIQAVAARLRGGAGPFERASRHGGEEFAVLLPRLSAPEAFRRAEAIRRDVMDLAVPASAADPIQATISIGVATCCDGCTGLVALLQKADEALYRAKRAGRNRSTLYGAPLPAEMPQPVVPAASPRAAALDAAADVSPRRRLASAR